MVSERDEHDDQAAVARRRRANVRLAVLLALVAVAVYAGFILSYL